MGEDAAQIRKGFYPRLGQIARELAKELYPDGLSRGTKFTELGAAAGRWVTIWLLVFLLSEPLVRTDLQGCQLFT